MIAVTAPYISVERRKASRKISVDEQLVATLKDLRADASKMQELLDNLSIQQLRQLCKRIGHPVASSATSQEIKAEVIRTLQADDVWSRISGRATADSLGRRAGAGRRR
jgi:hypothetical protein